MSILLRLKDHEKKLRTDIHATSVTMDNIIFCYSKTLSTLYVNALPDQVFEITKINNYKEFIFNLLNFYIPITYLKEDDDFWYELLSLQQ